MDNKMISRKNKVERKKPLLSLSVAVFLLLAVGGLNSCKENKWIDWKTQNEMWLERNKTQPGVETLSSGLQFRKIADPGAKNGESKPNLNSTIVCDYTAKLINGYTVSAAYGVTLDLSGTIPGFAEGCHQIHTHGDIELFIPAYLGYDYEKYNNNKYGKAEGFGTEGTTGYIPPYSTLIYTVHICSIAE
ncbi:MAG: FKBP-type peptidyl-prolyl cis-trans isomerase [Paludibacteraceae bacterium]|nr:FKBP-type peptidyl-prolyl cis-trans isomerase [Paludibacteraceae bacterium]